MAKPWSIIGAGPVGSIQAVLLATIFPGQEVHIFDQRETHQRNHGLQIRNATIEDINNQLNIIATEIKRTAKENSPYHQLVLENIEKTKEFLKENFKSFTGGQFVRTKTISIKLQKFAEEMGKHNAQILGLGTIEFHMGAPYKITEEQLNKLKKPPATNESAITEAEKIVQKSSMIFGADGSHSRVRAEIFNDPEPEKDVIQHLVEIKLDTKRELKEKSYFASSQKSSELMDATSDFISHSVLPTLRRGKLHVWTVGNEGTATLHILVKKEIFNALLSKANAKGQMGAPGNAYTRLRQLPIENGVRSLITEAIRDTIGLNNIESESIKVTTIPMHVYIANSLVTIMNGKLYILPGDAGAGLIFIRGVNNGLQSSMAYVSALFELFKDFESPEKISEYEFTEQMPEELKECETQLKAMYHRKVKEIKDEQAMIDLVVKSIETTSEISATSFKLISSKEMAEENELLYEPGQTTSQQDLRRLLQDLDNELDKIQLVLDEEGNDLNANYKAFRAWLPALDLLANQFDEEIYKLERKSVSVKPDEEYLKKILTATINLVSVMMNTQDKKAQREFILQYKNDVAKLTKEATSNSGLLVSLKDAIRTMLNSHAPSSSRPFFMTKLEIASQTVIEEGLSLKVSN